MLAGNNTEMISCPKVTQVVQVWYAAKWRAFMPLHGRVGRVVVSSRGRPRNHGVEIDGTVWIVPAGNLREPK
jgi:hypothetical protein